MDVKASEVVDELKVYWEQILKTANDKNLSLKQKEEDFGKILRQIAQALNKHNLK